jgi:hypothetical protein
MARAPLFAIVRRHTENVLTSHDHSRAFVGIRLFRFRDAEVPGSNPGTPTMAVYENRRSKELSVDESVRRWGNAT